MRLSVNPAYGRRVFLYLSSIALVWMGLVVPLAMEMKVPEGRTLFATVWLASYAFLSVTTAYAFTTYAAYFFVKPAPPLLELPHFPVGKTVALVCPIRNEDVGLFERLSFCLKGNVGGPIHFWLISDSDAAAEENEQDVLARLRTAFPDATIRYRRREKHTDFKPGNISDWLFLHGGEAYDYFFVMDADSLIQPGSIAKLLRQAEHPANADIGHFQCRTAIVHDFTHFAHVQKINLDLYERLVFPTINAICGQWISYGHSNLIKTSAFVLANPPTNEFSHDVFDAALLDRAGYRSVVVPDITVYEEAPANYSVAHKRDKRWAQGSLRALILIFDNKISLIERFFVLHGAMGFINNVVFLFWILAQYWDMVFEHGQALVFPTNFALGPFALNRTLFLTTAFAMSTFLLHPFIVVRNAKDLRESLWVLLFSNVTMMNNLVLGAINVLSLFFSPLRAWAPMEKDPFANFPIVKLLKNSWVPSLLCTVLILCAWESSHVWWILFTSPAMIGGIVSPLFLWWSGTQRKVAPVVERPTAPVPAATLIPSQ